MAFAAVLSLVVGLLASAGSAAPTPTPAPFVAAMALYGNPNCAYSAPMYFGSQGPFFMVMDTGSSNMAVASSQCSSCGVSPELQYSGSGNSQVQVQYGDLSQIEGPVATETVALGSSSGPSLSVSLIAIEQQSGFYQCTGMTGAYQGIVGLAFAGISQSNVQTFMNAASSVHSPYGFTFQMCDVQDNTGRSGNFWLGGADTSFATAPFQYAKIVQQQFYNVQVNSFSVGGTTLSLNQVGSNQPWIVDTATTNILFRDQNDYNTVVNAIINGGFVKFADYVSSGDQNDFWQNGAGLPYNALTISTDKTLNVGLLSTDGSTITIQIATTNFIQEVVENGEQGWVFQGFGQQSTVNNNILGVTLLKNMLVFFDGGTNNRIGFAPGTNCNVQGTVAGINVYASNDARPTTASSVVLPLVALALFASLFVI